jgi:hypothetical protein
MKKLIIEWKHLDVEGETCDRCYDTGENLANEVKRLNRSLQPKGIEVELLETKLDETDNFCRENIVTIGFCPRGWWLRKPGLSHYGTLRYHKDALLSAVAQYNETKNEIHKCIAGTKNETSKRDLELLENRTECSAYYLQAFAVMNDLHPLFKNTPEPILSKQDSNLVVLKSKIALTYQMKYLKTFSKFILDRGCEGNLISFYWVPMMTLNNIINKFGNARDNVSFSDNLTDVPPEPGQ